MVKPSNLAHTGAASSIPWANLRQKTALENKIHVPLAIPADFPKPGAPGCITLFTDAARKEGTGGGAFLAIHTVRFGPVLLWCEFDWPEDIRKSLMENQLSIGLPWVRVIPDPRLTRKPGLGRFNLPAAARSATSWGWHGGFNPLLNPG